MEKAGDEKVKVECMEERECREEGDGMEEEKLR